MVMEAMILILVMMNAVENPAKGKKGQLKMTYCSKNHFRKKNMERWPINKLQQNCWIGKKQEIEGFIS
uniref:Alternative protein FRA10AC1 n=1 Tax=Homo sapiens TaxID=9606 RepID=L8E962_HUMAN|nr:alternative protein FRA10AC1 [Homo sapiens]